MKKILILALSLLPVFMCAQSSLIEDNNGAFTIIIEDAGTGKDPVWSAITMLTAKAIKAKATSTLIIFGTRYVVTYTTSKMYSLSCDDTVLLVTTTVAAVKQTINTHAYEKKTGNTPPPS